MLDSKTRMAKKLGRFHTRHNWSKQNKREPLSKQHDNSKIAQRGSVRFFIRPNDTNQSQTPKGKTIDLLNCGMLKYNLFKC